MTLCQWRPPAPRIAHDRALDPTTDFEAALPRTDVPQFSRWPEALAPHVIPGTQRRELFRVRDERRCA